MKKSFIGYGGAWFMLHIGWRQIYEGYDMVLVGKIKEALEGENIDYKVEADNPARSRMSRDVLFG